MDVQQIKREMLRVELQSLIKILPPPAKRLSRQSGNQIKVDVPKPGRTQLVKGARDICRVMSTAQLFQVKIVETLSAETCSIDTELMKSRQGALFRLSAGAAISG